MIFSFISLLGSSFIIPKAETVVAPVASILCFKVVIVKILVLNYPETVSNPSNDLASY